MDNSNILIYQTEDGQTRIETLMIDETVWLTQAQMVELFQTSKQNISLHIKNIFSENELQEISVVKDYLTTAPDGKNYNTKHYNLDVIISVGYRVKSHRGTQFRIWATQKLKEFLVKGFVMDDERLKQANNSNYFEELLARIRDIRSSEKVFWRKVLEIYATSLDYDPTTKATQLFFKTVQNKMHWAAHKNTAAEIVYKRSDSEKTFMGLTSFKNNTVRLEDALIAKNYLTAEELEILNRIVNAYLELAELQAIRKTPMYMSDWITRLDDFIKMSGGDILTHAGKISNKIAEEKAKHEYKEYKAKAINQISNVEKDYINYIENKIKPIIKKSRA
ncbi:MAG TPA: virulence RhuM family protein [Aquella sp.]|nr:virulence RhuM family protein [Aquella sp.]